VRLFQSVQATVNPGVVFAWPGNDSCIPEVVWRPRAARIAQSSAAAPPRGSAIGLIGVGVRTCASGARRPHGDDTIAVAVERGWGRCFKFVPLLLKEAFALISEPLLDIQPLSAGAAQHQLPIAACGTS
jgi:hypothetical protein